MRVQHLVIIFSSTMSTLDRSKSHQKNQVTRPPLKPSKFWKKKTATRKHKTNLSFSLSLYLSLYLSVCLFLSLSFILSPPFSLFLSDLVRYRIGFLKPHLQHNLCKGTSASLALYHLMSHLASGPTTSEHLDFQPRACRPLRKCTSCAH